MSSPLLFDLDLPPLHLEAGGTVAPHVARGCWWGPPGDLPALRSRARVLDVAGIDARAGPALPFPPVPTVLLVHALTGDARFAGRRGWWAGVAGPGRALDPSRRRLLCFNLLGSCHGSSGPMQEGFPPGPATTWDLARAQLAALDALGIGELELVTGGSLGALVTLAIAALAPERVRRIAPIAGAAATDAWVVGFDHVAREALRLAAADGRGLSLARQIAMLTYRAPAGLELRQPRPARFDPRAPLPVQTYLARKGEDLVRRFDPRSLEALTRAMDLHDIGRAPGAAAFTGFGLDRIRASTLGVSIDTDRLFDPAHTTALVRQLRDRGVQAEAARIESPHGHDAFLLEQEQVDGLLRRALELPPGGPS